MGVCSAYCHPNASFSAQAEPLAETRTLQGYTDWMKGLLGFMASSLLEMGSHDLLLLHHTAPPT
jgi:hypothetical protein